VSRRGEGLRRVEEEIAREKAAALGRAGERLSRALEDIARIAARLPGTVGAERERLLLEYDEAWVRAREARLALLIQREALGLRRHAVVDELFPEPPRRPAAAARPEGRAGP